MTSEITNHISDSHSDAARLDTQINIKTVLPMPSVALFYMPTGKIKEDVLREVLSSTADDVVGFYKYRANNSIKPTFRDKLISKGLHKYFEKYHNRKNFVTCNIVSKTSVSGSTHTLSYRFGKINCFNMYEFIEDVTANLGEKLTGYKKVKRSVDGVFNKIVNESGINTDCSGDAILLIQDVVNNRLAEESKLAAKNELRMRELEAEIKEMHTILSERQANILNTAFENIIEEKQRKLEQEMAKECVVALKMTCEAVELNNLTNETNHVSGSDGSVQIIEDENSKDRSPSAVLVASRMKFNYAAALKSSASTSSSVSIWQNLLYIHS